MMAVKNSTTFENAIIEHILNKEGDEFREHLPFLKVERRENTGVGIYVYFKYLGEPPTARIENRTIGQSVYAKIEGLQKGVGFMLYIDDGRITMLECFSHSSEAWPSQIPKFEIQDL